MLNPINCITKINRIKQKLWFAPNILKILILKWMTTPLNQVPKFKHIDSIFTEDEENKEDIIQRVKEAKVMFNNRKQLLCSNNLGLEVKRETNKTLYLEFCSLWI